MYDRPDNTYAKVKALREEGYTAKQIAHILGITIHTVRYYIKLFNRQEKGSVG